MNTTGELRGIQISYPAHRAVITLEVDCKPEEMEQYREQPLDVSIAKHREKRTLTANAYYWELCSKLASSLRISRTEMHNRLLAEYGQYAVNSEGVAEWAIKSPKFDWTRCEETHYRPDPGCRVVVIKGKRYPLFWVIKGSHLYDKAEMAELIDGVVSECKEQGIETRPEEEVRRMWETYGSNAKA